MEYTRLNGSVSQAEPWCPGPTYQSIWALDQGRAVVISVRTGKEIAWDQPDPVPVRIKPSIRAWAEDVLHRRWQYEGHRRRDVENPTDSQVSLARKALKQHDRYTSLCKVYREAHTAGKPLADKRFVDLWQDENDEHHPSAA